MIDGRMDTFGIMDRGFRSWLAARIFHEGPKQAARGDAYAEAIRSSIPTVIEVIINRDTGIPVTGTWQMPPIPEVQPNFGQRKVRPG